MLQLENKIQLDKKAILSSNLCDQLTPDDLKKLGIACWEGYQRDEQSRAKWLERNEAGMDLALQISKDKSFPWPGCANVTFPLITIAAMQFHARAYPAIVNGEDVVKCVVFGEDPEGAETAHAERVSRHMSWQLLYEDKSWEEQEDKAILNLSIVGTNFKKTYYAASLGHNVSELVLAKDFVLNYWAKSVEDCPRKTHRIPKFRNEIYENCVRGIWRDILEEPWYQDSYTPRQTVAQVQEDLRQGVAPPQTDATTSLVFLEQHCNLDLDGDGYAEPYIVTLEESSRCVVRIVTRFDTEDAIERLAAGPRKGQIIRIKATEYFTKKTFIPSPDGGIYDIGFGVFLGPLNEAVNSLVNMLLDAGTMQTTAGGFLGRGAKIRGGVTASAPFEWKRVDSTGDDLRKSIYPLPVNAPSDVLFQLLSLLINYTSRVSGTTDITVGENPGQNTPAATTQTMVEMGQKIYTAIFKRIWRASKEEFQKLYLLNGVYLALDKQYAGGATKEDYLGSADQIAPVADPNVTSDAARMQQAMLLKQNAAVTPGYNKDLVERRFLKALRIDNAAALFPGTEGQPPAEDPKVTITKMKLEGDAQAMQLEMQARAQELQLSMQKFIAELEETRRVNNAKIMQLTASAAQAAANAQSEQQYAQVAQMNAQLTLLKHENDSINKRVEHMLKAAEIEAKQKLEVTKKESKA